MLFVLCTVRYLCLMSFHVPEAAVIVLNGETIHDRFMTDILGAFLLSFLSHGPRVSTLWWNLSIVKVRNNHDIVTKLHPGSVICWLCVNVLQHLHAAIDNNPCQE